MYFGSKFSFFYSFRQKSSHMNILRWFFFSSFSFRHGVGVFKWCAITYHLVVTRSSELTSVVVSFIYARPAVHTGWGKTWDVRLAPGTSVGRQTVAPEPLYHLKNKSSICQLNLRKYLIWPDTCLNLSGHSGQVECHIRWPRANGPVLFTM